MKFIKKIIKVVRYVLAASKADDCWRKKQYSDALKYTLEAENIAPLRPDELLRRAHIYWRIREYSMSMDEAKKAIVSIENRRTYPTHDKNYLIYYASRIGLLSQCSRDNIDSQKVDEEFRKVKFEHLVLTNVSMHHLRNFPLKSDAEKETLLYNQ